MAIKIKIKKGDKVIVVTGKNKGVTGEVLKVFPEKNKATVRGVNIVKRHTKPTQNDPGGIKEKESPINISNIAFLEETKNKASKIGYNFIEFFGERIRNKNNPIWSDSGIKRYLEISKKKNIKIYSFCDNYIINNSLTPLFPKFWPSINKFSKVELFCNPLIIGMEQNEHTLSQPSAIFKYA